MVPPTGNGVLNQIPAGDGRESSREQAVPDDGALLLRTVQPEAGRPPPWVKMVLGVGSRAASLTHQKKKKWNELELGPGHHLLCGSKQAMPLWGS